MTVPPSTDDVSPSRRARPASIFHARFVVASPTSVAIPTPSRLPLEPLPRAALARIDRVAPAHALRLFVTSDPFVLLSTAACSVSCCIERHRTASPTRRRQTQTLGARSAGSSVRPGAYRSVEVEACSLSAAALTALVTRSVSDEANESHHSVWR